MFPGPSNRNGPRGRRSLRRFLAVLLAVWMPSLTGAELRAGTDGEGPRESQVKAAFVLKFFQYIEWPSAAWPDADSALRVGVLGDPALAADLERAVEGRQVSGRRVEVLRSPEPDDWTTLHALVVAQAADRHWAAEARRVAGRPLLSVGESSGFVARGGVIGFLHEGKQLRFEVNLREAQRSGLRLDARLVSLASRVVRSGEGEGGR